MTINSTLSVADGWDRFDNILPISSSLINLVFECLSHRETWITRAPIPFAIKVFFGHWMEREIQVKILIIYFNF